MVINGLIDMENLPGMGKVKDFFNYTDNIGANLKTLVENITTFNNYVLHPHLFVRFVWNKVVAASFDVCVVIALAGVLLFICGNKKGRNLTLGSMMAYYLIKCLSSL
jgi:hypothetical protein